jgi:hypothetical protein
MELIWVTKDGITINIRDMASSHLLNTIHMIERNRFTQATEAAMREAQNPTTDAYDWEHSPVQYYLQWPIQYEQLIAEAQRRHLIARCPQTSKTVAMTRKRK